MDELFIAIETLVNNFASLSQEQLPQADIHWGQWAPDLDKTLASFFQQSLNAISRLADQQEASRFVHTLQGKFNDLVESIFRFGSASAASPMPPTVYDNVCQQLTVAIDDFSKQFGRYLNPLTPLPYTHSQIVGRQMGKMVSQIQELYHSTRVDKPLLSIALKPLVNRATNPTGITYYELSYLQALSSDLRQLRIQEDLDTYTIHFLKILSNQLKEIPFNESKTNVLLNVVLLHYNFNSPEYISFCVLNLMEKLDTLPTPEDKIKILRLYIRMLQQVIIRPGASLLPGDLPPANQQIRSFIEAEITYQESKLNGDQQHRSFEKIDTALSSYELPVVVELLMKDGVITDTNRSKIYRVISNAFNTVGSDDVSPESLRSKGNKNNMKASAVHSIRARVIKWLEIIRSW
ncbi:hypothetical protein DCC81_03705 [Chitinophaga parva]|uniref:Uncharacterized protein n=1 Tax=Chitinophaga parva TaxID=2169414 RepID=A0A2T7BLS5_9BACT|nr:hypothetical protein [Chitinophaga parva]PUZ28599.1 hypothetical protein DCC81_03705 [Chitinophaga parva]